MKDRQIAREPQWSSNTTGTHPVFSIERQAGRSGESVPSRRDNRCHKGRARHPQCEMNAGETGVVGGVDAWWIALELRG